MADKSGLRLNSVEDILVAVERGDGTLAGLGRGYESELLDLSIKDVEFQLEDGQILNIDISLAWVAIETESVE